MSDIKTLFLQLLSEENEINFVPDGEGHSHTFMHDDNEYKVHMLPHPKRKNVWEATFLRKNEEGNWTDKPGEKPGSLSVWKKALNAVGSFKEHMPDTEEIYAKPSDERLRPIYHRHLSKYGETSEPNWAGKLKAKAKAPISIKF